MDSLSRHYQAARDGFVVSTDRQRLDFPSAHRLLEGTYWAKGMPADTLRTALENSLTFGLYCGDETIGLARVVTDYSTVAYLTDVVIDERFRGRGLGLWMMSTILKHPRLQGLRRFLLVTADAHGLYQKLGFRPPDQPEWFLEIRKQSEKA